MTHEEITNRAIDAAASIDKGDSAVTVIHLRPHFESLVRATLQEAARAVCRNCDAEVPLLCNEHGEWVHYDDDGSGQCDAGPIHDLIAAPEEEGS